MNISIMVHGDDFVAVGPDHDLDHVRKTLETKYKIKVEAMGCGEGDKSEVRILNKVIRMTKNGIELEADPRHAELAVKELGLDGSRPSPVPGSKEVTKDKATTAIESGKKTTAARKARTELQKDVDSVESARKSAGGNAWDCEDITEVKNENDVEHAFLDPASARL